MKERSSLNTNNIVKTTSNTSSTSSISNANNTNSTLISNPNETTNITDPYNSNNFMAPPIGSTVKCVTCLGNNVQGKVIAYDQQTKMLSLRSNSSNRPGLYDYSMVNVAWCSNLQVIEEPNEIPEQIVNLNIQKLERRKRLNIENKLKEINSLGNDVTPLAQNLYFTIYKTLNDVEWDGKNIVVMETVVINPPYDVVSCHGRNGENLPAVEHVKKIVKKFHEDYAVNSN